MLVLTRKRAESIVIPELKVRIVVCQFKSKNRVLLGVIAPAGVKVLRGELLHPVHVRRARAASAARASSNRCVRSGGRR